MELLSKNSGVFNPGIQERKWKIILAGRGFSERMELGLDNIITGGFGLCISTSRDLHTKKLTQLYMWLKLWDCKYSLEGDFRACYYYEKVFIVWWLVRQINWHKYNPDLNWSLINVLPSGLGKIWKGHRRLPGEAKIIQKKAVSAFARTPWWVACRADSLQGKAHVDCCLIFACLCVVNFSIVNRLHITDCTNQSATPVTRNYPCNIWTAYIMQILQGS